MNVTIRNMKPDDIQAVQHVAKQSWHATYEGIIPHDIQQNFLARAYSDPQMQLRLERTTLYVAEMNDEIVGFANYSPIKPNGDSELGAIYVLPDAQGYGIGTAFLKRAIADFPQIERIFINVEKENDIGMRFYTAKGFQTVEQFDDELDGHVSRMVRMVLTTS